MSKSGEPPRMPKSGAGQSEGSETDMRHTRGTLSIALQHLQQSLSLVFLPFLISSTYRLA
jgi:hypothetical protein